MQKFKQKQFVSIILFLSLFVSVLMPLNANAAKGIDQDTRFSLADVKKDADFLIKDMETNHVIFGLNEVPRGYAKAKSDYLGSLKDNMSPYDFFFKTNKYLAAFESGHTLAWYDAWPDTVLPIILRYYKGKAIVIDNANESIPKGAEIVSIGGKSVAQLNSLLSTYFAAENTSAQEINFESWATSSSFHNEIKSPINGNSIEVVYNHNGTQGTKALPFAYKLERNGEKPHIKTETKNNTFIFTLPYCEDDKDFRRAISELKNAVSKGIKNVILDVRWNAGGDLETIYAFYSALGMKVPQYGTYQYICERLYRDFNASKDLIGASLYYPPVKSNGNPKINLKILVNRESFSAATMAGIIAQDGNLGKVIGEISANAPNCTSSVLYYKLSKTRLSYAIAYEKLMRPDDGANKNELIPDILLTPDQDAMEYAFR